MTDIDKPLNLPPKTQLTLPETKQLLQQFVGKKMLLSCGYGGVIFGEIGQITEHRYEYITGEFTTRRYGTYRLFCDENWSFKTGDGTKIERWTSSSHDCDELFTKIGTQTIVQVEVDEDFNETRFVLSDGSVFTVLRDDSIDTFQLTLIPEQKKLTVYGDQRVELMDYQEDQQPFPPNQPRPKPTPTVEIDREFLRKQMPDYLTISPAKANEFMSIILNQTVEKVVTESATVFSLEFADRRWTLTIDELWTLNQDNQVVLDVREAKFHFTEQLSAALIGQKIEAIHFEKSGKKLTLQFSDGYTLSVQESDRYSRWGFHDFATGLSISAYRDHGLSYRVSAPIHLYDSYKTADVHWSAILYELHFYRQYFAQHQQEKTDV